MVFDTVPGPLAVTVYVYNLPGTRPVSVKLRARPMYTFEDTTTGGIDSANPATTANMTTALTGVRQRRNEPTPDALR